MRFRGRGRPAGTPIVFAPEFRAALVSSQFNTTIIAELLGASRGEVSSAIRGRRVTFGPVRFAKLAALAERLAFDAATHRVLERAE